MSRRLTLRRIPREELAAHLREVEVLAAEAVGETSVYHCLGRQGESVAIALPGDRGLIVEIPSQLPTLERRRRKQSAGK